jgi:transposase-like protein
MRQTLWPLTAGDRHGFPVLFDLAWHRNAWCIGQLCMGLKRNSRNGYSKKRVLTETSKLNLRIPRDRKGTFDPKLIARYQRRFPGFDEKIMSMYARGMTVREIQGHLLELYGLEVSPDLISTVTDAVLETVAEWQNRPLEPMYPLVFFDALRVKIRDEGLKASTQASWDRNKAATAQSWRRNWERVIPSSTSPRPSAR